MKTARSSSQFLGVTRHGIKWRAQVSVGHRPIYCGRYDTEEQAARAYDKNAIAFLGPDTKLNFPGDRQRLVQTVTRREPPPKRNAPVQSVLDVPAVARRPLIWLTQLLAADDIPCEFHLLFGGTPCHRWATHVCVRGDKGSPTAFCPKHDPQILRPADQVVFL